MTEDDFDRSVQLFCETIKTRIDTNAINVNRIVFSDESTFMLQ